MRQQLRDRGIQRLALLIGLLLVAGSVGFAGSAAFAAGSRTVTIGATLTPKNITVAPGTTITWTAVDATRHRVRSTSGPAEFESGDITQSKSWSHTFAATGTYSYLDDRQKDNPALQGTVTVGAGTPTGGGGGAGTPAPTTVAVSLAGKRFNPVSVTVAVGGVVTWTNNDSMDHNVTATGGAFRSATLKAGQVFTFKFTKPGTYAYLCTLHGGMNGTILVATATGTVPAPPRPPTAGPNPPAPPAGAGQTKTYQVAVKDNSFTPSTVHARVGDTITWTNLGRMPHTVTAQNGSFNRQVAPGQRFSYALRAQGTVPYVCSFHPGMAGTLVVGAPLAGVAVPPPAANATGGGSGTHAAAAAPVPASGGLAKTYEIKVQEMSFAPVMQAARVGDTISWVNVGSIPHTVTAKDGSFDKTVAPGERYNVVLRKEGDISYVCTFHPGMNGMLMVGPALAGVTVPGAAGGGSSLPPLSAPHQHGKATSYEIQVKDNSFNPAMLDARVGDSVTWVNVGALPHTVTAKDRSFDKSLLPGQRFTLRLTQVGVIDYVCTPHPGMFGQLTVGPAETGPAPAGPPLSLGALPPLTLAGFGTGWLVVICLLAAAQLRARAAGIPRRPLERIRASGDPS